MSTRTSVVALASGEASVNGLPLAGCRIIGEADLEWTDIPVPDAAWTHVDAAGHFHAWDHAGELPTLNRRVERRPCDGTCGGTCGGDGYTEVVRTCKVCKAVVKPGTVPGRRPVPGAVVYTAEVLGVLPVQLDGATVSLDCGRAGFGFGQLSVVECEIANGQSFVHARITLNDLHHRRQPAAPAVPDPATALPYLVAAHRALSAALPLLGLDKEGNRL